MVALLISFRILPQYALTFCNLRLRTTAPACLPRSFSSGSSLSPLVLIFRLVQLHSVIQRFLVALRDYLDTFWLHLIEIGRVDGKFSEDTKKKVLEAPLLEFLLVAKMFFLDLLPNNPSSLSLQEALSSDAIRSSKKSFRQKPFGKIRLHFLALRQVLYCA